MPARAHQQINRGTAFPPDLVNKAVLDQLEDFRSPSMSRRQSPGTGREAQQGLIQDPERQQVP